MKHKKKKKLKPIEENETIALKVSDVKKKTKKKLQNTIEKIKALISSKKDQRNDLLSLHLPCEDIFNYMVRNEMVNQKQIRITSILTFMTMIFLNALQLVFYGWCRPNYFTKLYTCFDMDTNTYMPCIYRTFCSCENSDKCCTTCYSSSRYDCAHSFVKPSKLMELSDFLFTSGKRVMVIYEDVNNDSLTLFQRMTEKYCKMEYYCTGILASCFTGAMLGELTLGLFAVRYGKKLMIITLNLILVLNMIFITIYRNWTFDTADANQILSIFSLWCTLGFVLGFCSFQMESMLYLLYIENYLDHSKLQTINGIFHSHYSISYSIFFLFNKVVGKFEIYFYFSLAYFFIFSFLFFFFIVETPRFYSERKNYDAKRQSLYFYYTQPLMKKKSDGADSKEEVYIKHVILFDPALEQANLALGNSDIKETIKQKAMEDFCSKNNQRKVVARSMEENRKILVDLANSDARLNLRDQSINKKNASLPQEKRKLKKKSDKVVISKNISLFHKNPHKIIQTYLLKTGQKHSELHLRYILTMFRRDPFLKKNFWHLLLCWLSISTLFSGAFLTEAIDTMDPNFKINTGVKLYIIIMTFAMPIIIGYISQYISSTRIISLFLLIFGILCILIDWTNTRTESDRVKYLGAKNEQSLFISGPYNRATCAVLMTVVYSLFDLLIITSVPTLYRTLLYSILKGISRICIFVSICAFYFIDTPNLLVGMLSFFLCGFFIIVRFSWKEEKLEELVDLDDAKDSFQSQRTRRGTAGPKDSVWSWMTRLRQSFSLKIS